jgi:hypothetical protein
MMQKGIYVLYGDNFPDLKLPGFIILRNGGMAIAVDEKYGVRHLVSKNDTHWMVSPIKDLELGHQHGVMYPILPIDDSMGPKWFPTETEAREHVEKLQKICDCVQMHCNGSGFTVRGWVNQPAEDQYLTTR